MMRGAGAGAGAVGGGGGGVGGGPAGATLVVASLQLVWNHPFLTGFVMLMFTPPFFPLVVYFSPLVMSTALCIAALVSLGSQMEKIKAEGGEQLEIRLGFENGVGAWVESTRPDRREALNYRFGSSSNNNININSINNNMSSNIINSINPQATEVGHWARDEDGMVSEEAESDSSEGVSEEIISEEEEEDQWDAWVKEYEEEWEDIEDTEPIVAVTSIARHPPSPTPTPPPPQPRQKEIVAEEQQPVLRPLVPLAPIRTGREPAQQHGSVKMVDRHVNPVDEHTKKVIPSKDGRSGTSKAHVSDVEALQSIEKLLHMELLSRPKMMEAAEVPSPDDDGGGSKHQDNNIVPADVIHNLKTGGLGSKGKDASARVRVSPVKESSSSTTTPKLQQIAGANVHNYTEVGSSSSLPQPDDVHTARSENIERVVRQPPFSPQFLQSLQPLPPKDPPRLLHNLKPGRLGNPVEKFPEWVYARPHQERMLIGHKVSATDQTKQMQICEEKHHHHHHHVMDDVTTASEVKVVSSSHSRRRAHANRAIGLEGTTDQQQQRRQQQQQQQQQEETMPSSSTLKAAIPEAKVVTHGHHPEDELAPQSIIIHDGISPAPMTSRRRRHSSHHHHHQQYAAVVGAIGSGTPQRRVEEKIESVPKNNIPSSMQVEDDDVHAEKEMASDGSQDLQVNPVLDQWGRGFSAQRSTPRKSRRKFEPRTVVSQDINNSFSLKKSSSLRNGKAIQYVDTSSDEHKSVTPRARRTERTNKPLVWRSHSSQTQEDTN